MARDPALDHFEARQFSLRPFGLLTLEDVASHEIAFFELDDPGEVGFQRGGGVIDVVAIERHLRFEAERVARAEAARRDVAGRD